LIYLIGGPARCGKSTLAERVCHEVDGSVISADSLRDSLQRNLRASWIPDIFSQTVAPAMKMSSVGRQIDRLRRRDEGLWQFCASYIDAEIEAVPHEDMLIEGNLWPDFVESLQYTHRAVFMVDTSPVEKQFEWLRSIRDDPDADNNWMRHRGYADRRLMQSAKLNLLRSQRYIQLCREHGYPYFDIAQRGIGYAQDRAYVSLLQK
jgi:hypothetical protein